MIHLKNILLEHIKIAKADTASKLDLHVLWDWGSTQKPPVR